MRFFILLFFLLVGVAHSFDEHLHCCWRTKDDVRLCFNGTDMRLNGHPDERAHVQSLAVYLSSNYFWRQHNSLFDDLRADQLWMLAHTRYAKDGSLTTLLDELDAKDDVEAYTYIRSRIQ